MGSLYALAIANLAKTAKIEQLLAQKEEFLCSVSHEIKTPLAKAKLALEFIEDGSKKDKVQNAIRQIDILTSTLLNAHRKEQTSQQKCKASFLLSEAKKAILSEDNIDVEIVNDFEIESNLGECTTAIKNLLENAVKHSSDNKCKVVVDKSCIEVSNTTLSPLDELESLNKPFKKGENSTGFGLGLYLVQSIANRNKFSLKLLQQDGVAKFQMIFGAQK